MAGKGATGGPPNDPTKKAVDTKKKAKKPAKKPAGGGTTTTTTTTAPHSTLDLAAMQGGQGVPDQTDVTQIGGPDQADAVFSTGQGGAQQLNYAQTTTYQEVYAQQLGGAGAGTTTGGAAG